MKDSGVAWIGEIPDDWEVIKTKNVFRNVKRIVGEQHWDCERLALTLNGVIKRNKDEADGLQPEKFDTYQFLYKNELVFKLIDLGNIATSRVGLSPFDGMVSPAYIILHNDCSDNRFYYYYYLSMWHRNIFNSLGDNGVRSSIGANDLLNLPIVDTNEAERIKIADFLDKKCAEIDCLIAHEETMIDELKAYKQSVIAEAVTKGLDRTAPMKDSGIEWVDEIPTHWGKDKSSRIFGEIGSGTTPKGEDYFFDGTVNWIQSGDINGGELTSVKNLVNVKSLADFPALKIYAAPFLVIAMYGASVGHISISLIDACTNQACCVMRNSQMDFRYSFYSLTAVKEFLLKRAVGGGQPNISQTVIRQIWFAHPPKSEQRQIAEYLDRKCSEIDRLISLKQEKIEELREYKKSLIYEYVTGKKEVCG